MDSNGINSSYISHQYSADRLGISTTPVDVKGIDDSAFDAIVAAIKAQTETINRQTHTLEDASDNEASVLGNLANGINNLNDDNKKRDISDRVRSMASERNERASRLALDNNIKKTLGALDILKTTISSCFDKMADILKDSFKQSLRSFTDLSKAMRAAKLTESQKKLVGNAARESVTGAKDIYGVNVSQRAANDAITALLQQGLVSNISAMSKESKDAYVSLVSLGMDAQKAYAKATTLSKEQLQKEIYASSDKQIQGIVDSLNSKITDVERLNKFGGADKASQQIIDAASGFAKTVGGFMSNESVADLGKIFLNLKSGNIAGMDEKALEEALAVFGTNMEDIKNMTAEQMGQAISERIKKAAGNQEELEKLSNQLYVLQKGQVGEGGVLDELARGVMMAAKDPSTLGRKVRTKDENKEALADNTENGKISQGTDYLVSSIDGMTNGALSSLSNGLDEYFGDQLTLEDLVSSGFKLVTTLLTSIVLSDVIKGGFNKLGETVGSAITGSPIIGGKSAAKGAVKPPPTPAARAKMAAAGNNVIKSGIKTGAKAIGKGVLKGIPVVGVVAGLGLAAYDIYDAATYKPEDISTDLNTEVFKEEEKKLQEEMKAAKITGAILKTGALAAGALAGAKMGAVIGTAIPVPVVGTAIGAVVGTAIGATAGVVVDHFVEASNNLKQTELTVKGITDLDKEIKELDGVLKNTTDQRLREQILELKKNTEAQRDQLLNKLNEGELAHWQKMTGGSTSQDIIDQLRQTLQEADTRYNSLGVEIKKQEELKKQLLDDIASGKVDSGNGAAQLKLIEAKIKSIDSEQAAAKQLLISSRLALEKSIDTDLTDEYGTENIGEILTKVREDAGDEKWQLNQESYEAQLKKKLLDQLDEGVGGNDIRKHLARMSDSQLYAFLSERAKSSGMMNQDKIDEFILEAVAETAREVGDQNKLANFKSWLDGNKELQEQQLAEAKKANEIAQQPTDINLVPNSAGGVYSSFTPAAVGEAGKEAIVPLERPDDMKRVLNSLDANEKLFLLKTLLNTRTSITWDVMSEALSKVLGIGSKDQLKANTLTSNIIAGAAAQKGHSYTEMVCNQMVEAALKYAGFKPPTTGVVTRHFNHPKMHIVLNDPVNGIDPNNPALIPGMIMFSHPFTQAEADQLNRQKGGHRKAGDPGHMGIYAGDSLWWNSTSSKNTVDYSSGKGVKVGSNRGVGVALTKPITKGTYKLYAAGYYEGMFDRSSASSLPSASKDISLQEASQISNSKSAIKRSGLLTNEEIEQLASEAGINNKYTMEEFTKQASNLLNSNVTDRESIIAILTDIARFLKGAITKQPMMSVNRPAASIYH